MLTLDVVANVARFNDLFVIAEIDRMNIESLICLVEEGIVAAEKRGTFWALHSNLYDNDYHLHLMLAGDIWLRLGTFEKENIIATQSQLRRLVRACKKPRMTTRVKLFSDAVDNLMDKYTKQLEEKTSDILRNK